MLLAAMVITLEGSNLNPQKHISPTHRCFGIMLRLRGTSARYQLYACAYLSKTPRFEKKMPILGQPPNLDGYGFYQIH
jgi:hypothetical protein